jgi:superfamily II DNA or RNA helicase
MRSDIARSDHHIIAAYDPPLRKWQAEALLIWSRLRRGTVSVVTGGGKTIFCYLCMREALALDSHTRFLIIVPTLALLDQWVVGIQHDLGLSADAIQVLTSESRDADIKLVNVCVINTARENTARFTANGAWFLCVDECHRAGSPANSLALTGKFTATLGLSATPKRQYDSGFEERVAPLVGSVIYEYSFQEAVRDGVVTPFQLHNYRIPLTQSERHEYDRMSRLIAIESRKIGGTQHNTSKRLESLLLRRASVVVNARWRIPSAVALALQFSQPTIIFHERIEAANSIAALAQERGRRAVAYHTGLSQGMRHRNLALFREGIADTLVTCRSLDEGLNVPEAQIGIMAASTKSIRQRIQRLGRVIRRSPGKETSIVCTLYATDGEEAQLRTEVEDLSEIVSSEWYQVGVKHD